MQARETLLDSHSGQSDDPATKSEGESITFERQLLHSLFLFVYFPFRFGPLLSQRHFRRLSSKSYAAQSSYAGVFTHVRTTFKLRS